MRLEQYPLHGNILCRDRLQLFILVSESCLSSPEYYDFFLAPFIKSTTQKASGDTYTSSSFSRCTPENTDYQLAKFTFVILSKNLVILSKSRCKTLYFPVLL